jgi:hypothetical protein
MPEGHLGNWTSGPDVHYFLVDVHPCLLVWTYARIDRRSLGLADVRSCLSVLTYGTYWRTYVEGPPDIR